MPSRRPQLPTSPLLNAAPPDRRQCRLKFSDEFWTSAAGLAGIGSDETTRRAKAAAITREFFNAWTKRSAATDRDLNQGRWNYKQLKGKRAKAAKLRQIYLTSNQGGLRVALVVDEGDDCVMEALLTYHKRHQDAAIDRAASLALNRRRGQL